ncbi:hypothetical protein BLNAU_2445 [Blattamonas nauphoetae]|uniref:Uncharacterized protein n=1 Tax=Blattamonas nauphoetae TaxID=2049346 RepID=A0ABQ9YFR2_9EUKA|nr:hypothetical protein BLNAU_2445 [Blattamonas nauphoetae]
MNCSSMQTCLMNLLLLFFREHNLFISHDTLTSLQTTTVPINELHLSVLSVWEKKFGKCVEEILQLKSIWSQTTQWNGTASSVSISSFLSFQSSWLDHTVFLLLPRWYINLRGNAGSPSLGSIETDSCGAHSSPDGQCSSPPTPTSITLSFFHATPSKQPIVLLPRPILICPSTWTPPSTFTSIHPRPTPASCSTASKVSCWS